MRHFISAAIVTISNLLFVLGALPMFALAQADISDSDVPRQRIVDEITSATGAIPTATMVFHVPPEEIEQYQYYAATILDERIVSSGARPDESGVIMKNVLVAVHLSTGELAIPNSPAQTILAARNRESNEWYFQIHVSHVDLKTFISALAVTMWQPRNGTRPGFGFERPTRNGPPLRYDSEVPANERISINGDRLAINDVFAMILEATGCRITMELDTVVVSECQ